MRRRWWRRTSPVEWLLVFLAIVFTAGLIIVCEVDGADWRVPANFSAVYDTAYTCYYKDFVLDDSSLGRADDNDYDTTFTYTLGEYLRTIIWYKYDASDEWGTWTWEYNSATAATLDSAGVYGAVTAVLNDSTSKYQGGAGTGAFGVTIVTYDSTTSQTIPNVNVIIRPVDQSNVTAWAQTNTSGDTTFNLDAANYVFIASATGWTFPAYDTIEVSGTQEDTIYGDFIEVPVASGSQVCAVTVIVLDNAGDAAYNVRVTAYLTRSNLRDSAGYAVANYLQDKKTDVQGRVTFYCRWSSYLIPATKWRFTVRDPAVGQTKKEITVPRQSSYTLEF